jgi:hypothetical protein
VHATYVDSDTLASETARATNSVNVVFTVAEDLVEHKRSNATISVRTYEGRS